MINDDFPFFVFKPSPFTTKQQGKIGSWKNRKQEEQKQQTVKGVHYIF